MKIFNPIGLLAVFSTAVLLSSCSRGDMPLSSTGKMTTRQALAINKASTTASLDKNMTLCLPENIGAAQIALNAPANPVPGTLQSRKMAATHAPKNHGARVFFANAVHEIARTSAVVNVTNLLGVHGIASYSGTQQTQGFLGIAGICLIIAICLGVLGFTSGRLFWELGVILIVAAVVFFLLYLINKAASPSTP